MKFCKKLGSQEDLAARLYVTRQAVSKWETEKSFPEVTLLPKIAELLDTTVNDLLAETKEQKNENENAKYEKEVIAERTGFIMHFFMLVVCAVMISIYIISSPKFDVEGVLLLGMVIFATLVSMYIVFKDSKSPKIIIAFNGEQLEIYSKTKQTRYVELNQIKEVWTSSIGGAYSGRLKIFLINDEELLLYAIKHPAVVRGKIEAMKKYLAK